MPAPTLEQLVRHAQLFGSECVFETGECCLGARELARLRTALDVVDARRRFGRRRVSEIERTEQVRLLAAEGRTSAEIAASLGIGVRRVDRLLRIARNGHDRQRATLTLAGAVRAHKPPALEGVRSGV
jgi:DNA-binding CsgD family transcriptional regulator